MTSGNGTAHERARAARPGPRLGLRSRFSLVFLASAALTCAVGALGSHHVERVSRQAELVADVVTPVLAESGILHDTALRQHALVLDLATGAEPSDADARFAELDRLTRRSLARIAGLLGNATQAQYALDLARTRFGQFNDAVRRVRDAHAEAGTPFANGRLNLLKRDVQSAEDAYSDSLDAIGDIAREQMWGARMDQRQVVGWARGTAVASVLLGLALALTLGWAFSRRVVDPLARMTGAMRRLADGDLDAQVPVHASRDEIGEMSRALAVFKDNAIARRDLEAREAESRAALLAAAERERTQAVLRAQNERFEAALGNMTQGLAMFDRDHRLVVCNARFSALFDLPEELREPGTPMLLVYEHRLATGSLPAGCGYEELLRPAGGNGFEIDETQDGRSLSVRRVLMADGGWIVTYEDVTDNLRSTERLRHMAAHDALTDLPNRASLRGHLTERLRSLPGGSGVAVHCLDLDRFKDVNDAYGHPVGDALLKAVAARLAGAAPGTCVARLGGDEFAVVHVVASQADADALADTLLASLSAGFDIAGHAVESGASAGVAVAWSREADPDALLKQADIALHTAKAAGPGRREAFAETMELALRERRSLESDLRKAFMDGDLDLHYQPLVSFGSGRVTGFEALLRWTHPERGPVSPAVFVPVAEETGLIGPIGDWAIRKACADAARWPSDVKIAVNLSPVQFANGGDIVAVVAQALAASGLPPERLGLEVTESLLLEDDERTLETLHTLRRLGVRISLDDFGTGYSSLSYLVRFPFDRLKIDQSFVREMLTSDHCATIIRAVVGIARQFGMTTVAEGVETQAQFDRLRDKGCDEAQGYLISRPRPVRDTHDIIATRNPVAIAA